MSGPEDTAEEAVWRVPSYVDQAKVDSIFDDSFHEVIDKHQSVFDGVGGCSRV